MPIHVASSMSLMSRCRCTDANCLRGIAVDQQVLLMLSSCPSSSTKSRSRPSTMTRRPNYIEFGRRVAYKSHVKVKKHGITDRNPTPEGVHLTTYHGTLTLKSRLLQETTHPPSMQWSFPMKLSFAHGDGVGGSVDSTAPVPGRLYDILNNISQCDEEGFKFSIGSIRTCRIESYYTAL